MLHPYKAPNLHLIDIRHGVRLNNGWCGCRWNLMLKHLNLLLKRGNHHSPLLKLEVLLLVGVLEVYDCKSALVHQLTRCVKLLTDVVPRVLDLTEATVCDLQLSVLVWRRNCTTMEKVILTLQLCELMWDSDVALFISSHTQALLDDGPGGGVLQVERVLSILSHCSQAYIEVRTLGVGYGLKVLLPHGVPWIANRKEHDWHHGGASKATSTQGSEGDVCRLLDSVF
jgi:hypothetical protein